MKIAFRPVGEVDLPLLRRFDVEPGLAGNNWYGFQDSARLDRRFTENGFLTDDMGRLMVVADDEVAGFVVHWKQKLAGHAYHWEIGIALLPDFRGRGIGWRAQDMLADYLLEHTPVQRLQACTQPDNIAEQKALVKAGFEKEGVIRSGEFRAGQWQDVLLYSRLRG